MSRARWAPARSNAELERLALEIRKLLGFGEFDRVDILAAIDRASRLDRLRGLRVVIVSDEEMGTDLARCANRGRLRSVPVIEVGQSTYQAAREGAARAVMALAHELAHLFLPPISDLQARSAAGSERRIGVPAYENAEHQASYTAAAFLMPASFVSTCGRPEELAERSGVSLQAARIRWQQVIEKNKSRKVPAAVKHNQARLFIGSSGALRPQIPTRVDLEDASLAWDKADHPPIGMGLCLGEYRLSVEGLPVRWEDFRKNTYYGWYEADGKVYSYEHLRRTRR